MSSRDTYVASVKSAHQAAVATLVAADGAKQEAINASGSNVGYTLQAGNYANFAAAVKAANLARQATAFAAEHAKQTAINAARDALRAAGDFGPV